MNDDITEIREWAKERGFWIVKLSDHRKGYKYRIHRKNDNRICMYAYNTSEILSLINHVIRY